MIVIKNELGKVVNRSKSTRGLRAYINNHDVLHVSIRSSARNLSATLTVMFSDLSYCRVRFHSLKALCLCLLRWRGLYGSTLVADRVFCGKLSPDNEYLAAVVRKQLKEQEK